MEYSTIAVAHIATHSALWSAAQYRTVHAGCLQCVCDCVCVCARAHAPPPHTSHPPHTRRVTRSSACSPVARPAPSSPDEHSALEAEYRKKYEVYFKVSMGLVRSVMD